MTAFGGSSLGVWLAFPHSCSIAYTHAYTTPIRPLHHTDRSPRGSYPRLWRSSSCGPILRVRLFARRAVSFSVPPASHFFVNVAPTRYCTQLC